MPTRVLTVETAMEFQAAAREAAELLRRGEIVALPTETVYGLAANALDASAVEKIFAAKGRPAHNPIIVHAASTPMALECVAGWSDDADRLARAFWPGPLTIVLPRAPIIPDIVSAGGSTVGVRVPLHPLMRRVIDLCGFPLAAPSANPSNHLSPTTARHVVEGLGEKVPLVIDAGPTSVGIESTVIDLSAAAPRLLRPGMISARQIEAVLKKSIVAGPESGRELRSPGLLEKHYSPRARMIIASWSEDAELRRIVSSAELPLESIHVITYDCIPEANPFGRVAIIPHDEEAYARAIYAELHRSDELGAKLIVVERPPANERWEGIHDRLKRASA